MPTEPMASHRRQIGLRVDADGVRITDVSPTRRVLRLTMFAIAVPIVATVAVVVTLRLAPIEPTNEVTRAPANDSATRAVAGTRAVTPPALPVKPRPAARAESQHSEHTEPPPAAAEDDRPELSAKDVIPALIEAGERGGIAAFPLPGTKPIKRGIVVPEGFELPEGYVRHYQATDDGRRLPAILMVHPDYELVDANGARVPLPPDRVVPPEMAPPGLPIEMLEVPETEGAPDITP